MNRVTQFFLAAGAAGALLGCAQSPTMPMAHGMTMGQMPMMMGGNGNSNGAMSPQMSQMMAACMDHMQAMPSPNSGVAPRR